MPPVMGAAAFLMVEFIGISYLEVIKHAFIPAVISYIALVYIVHLEALKSDMPALGESKSLLGMLLKVFVGFAIAGVVFYGAIWAVGALRIAAPQMASWVVGAVVLLLYLAALKVAAARPELELDDPNAKNLTLPVMGPKPSPGASVCRQPGRCNRASPSVSLTGMRPSSRCSTRCRRATTPPPASLPAGPRSMPRPPPCVCPSRSIRARRSESARSK
jgi:hypothetical protein